MDAAVPHQLFSTTGLVAPLLRGLVGIGSGKLSPRIPPDWDRLRVENVRLGGVYDLDWSRRRLGKETIQTLTLTPRDGHPLPEISIEPTLPLGSKRLSGAAPWRTRSGGEAQTFSVRYRGGIEISPIHEPLRAGERSSRLRILDERIDGSTYVARLEGRRGKSYRLRLFEAEPREIEVVIPDGAGEWGFRELRVEMRN